MRYSMTIAIGVACMVVATYVRPLASQYEPAVKPIFVDYAAPPPAPIDRFAAEVDAVVRVRIESISFESPVIASVGRPGDVTNYTVRILDIAKAHPMLPPNQETLIITRLGGQHVENGTTVRSAQVGFEDFQKLGEYVLFLTWSERKNAFNIAYGPNGSYQLLPTGIVRPLGQSDVAKAQQGKRLDTFLQEVKVASVR